MKGRSSDRRLKGTVRQGVWMESYTDAAGSGLWVMIDSRGRRLGSVSVPDHANKKIVRTLLEALLRELDEGPQLRAL